MANRRLYRKLLKSAKKNFMSIDRRNDSIPTSSPPKKKEKEKKYDILIYEP
jgi:hypothetical protein